MNKILYKIFLLALGSLLFVRCMDDAESPSLEALPPFVQFDQATVDDFEDDGTVTFDEPKLGESIGVAFSVENPFGVLNEDVSVTFSLSGDAVLGVDYEIDVEGSTAEGGAFVIVNRADSLDNGNPSSARDDFDFNITLLGDAIDDGDKSLVIRLTGAATPSGTEISFERNGLPNRSELTINITDIDPYIEVGLPAQVTLLEPLLGEPDVSFVIPIIVTGTSGASTNVNFDLSGDLVLGTDYELLNATNVTSTGGSFTVPDDGGDPSNSFELELRIIGDGELDGNKSLVFTIADATAGISLTPRFVSEVTFTVGDIDTPAVPLEQIPGDYNFVAEGDFGSSGVVTIAAIDGGPENEFSFSDAGADLFTNPIPTTIRVLGSFVFIDEELAGGALLFDAGTISEDGTITLSYILNCCNVEGLVYTMTMTPVE